MGIARVLPDVGDAVLVHEHRIDDSGNLTTRNVTCVVTKCVIANDLRISPQAIIWVHPQPFGCPGGRINIPRTKDVCDIEPDFAIEFEEGLWVMFSALAFVYRYDPELIREVIDDGEELAGVFEFPIM